MSIFSHIQQPDLGGKVTLYQLDLTMFGQGTLYIAPGTSGLATAVGFGGQIYSPLPLVAKGFKVTTEGPLPRPTVTVSNIDNAFTGLVENNDDLLGAVLTRIRTYTRYLDGQPDADGYAHLPLDVYELAAKTYHSHEKITWQCKALMDQDGKTLPGRIVTRDYCDHLYRQYDGGAFDYTQATCPYVGGQYFNENDEPVAAAADKCSKKLTGCKLRFGANAPLPFRGFVGVARLRTR